MLLPQLLYFCVVFGDAAELIFSNSWGVEIAGGPEVADELARSHGFINKGQVGTLSNIYHFVHVFSPLREKRSGQEYHYKHYQMKAEEKVGYVSQQIVRSRVKRGVANTFPSAPSLNWDKLWYLNRSEGHDMNIVEVWLQNYTGRGVIVSVLDDGLEHTHPDLQQNYDSQASYDVIDNDDDPFPRYDPTNYNKHGTRCAGEVAASWGSQCCVGASFNARIGGVRMLDDIGEVNDLVEATALSLKSQYIDIYSSSWGPSDDGKTVDGPGELAQRAFINGTLTGRHGLGSIYVWASGNGGHTDSCNCDGYAVSPYTISVGSAGERDDRPYYLEQCSSTLVSTYSSGSSSEKKVLTTDLHGSCTSGFTGTSASAPLAAGIIALALEANQNLSWRDVQYLLIYTSNSDYLKDDHWHLNGAGLKVSHWYGFGIIDSTAIVNRARHWSTVPPRHNCTFNATAKLSGGERATAQQSLIVKVQVENCELVVLEHVQVLTTIQVLEGYRKDISIHLVSPAGTNSILLPFRPYDYSTDGFTLWPFMTVHSWGEMPKGNWTFTVEVRGQTEVELSSLELILHGALSIPSSVKSIPSTCHQECAKGCAREGPQYCDSCKHFRVASTLACVRHCPKGTYINGNVCLACSDHCSECNKANSCQKCLPDYFLLENATCLLVCPSNFYITNGSICTPCHESCLSCDGPFRSNCTQCYSQFVLMNTNCVLREASSCFEGTYFDYRLQECRSCHETCLSCSGRGDSHCTSCNQGQKLKQGRCIACELNEYFDNHTSQCSECPEMCKLCSDPNTCLSCQEGSYLTSNANCVTNCPENTTADNDTLSCVGMRSHSLCSNCSNISECANCSQREWRILDGKRVSECPPQYIDNGGICTKCSRSCKTCYGLLETNCLSCYRRDFLNNASCVSSCPNGTFPEDGKCLRCMNQCSLCRSLTSCELCIHGHFYHPVINACVPSCPTSYFEDGSTRKCKKCPANCKQCQGSDCITCQEGYFYYASDRKCSQQCPEGYYPSQTSQTCLQCDSPCTACIGTASNCSSCSAGMALKLDSQSCEDCCVKEDQELLCCDCDKDGRHCILSDYSNATTMKTVPFSTHSIWIVAGVLVSGLLLVVVIILVLNITIKHTRLKLAPKYTALPKEDYLEQETEFL